MGFTAKRRGRQNARLDRGELITAARRAFTDLGTTASMAEVAAAAGVTEAELSGHFDDRDALLVAVIADLEESLRGIGSGRKHALTATRPRIPRSGLRQSIPPLAVIAALMPLGAPAAEAAAVEPTPMPARVLTIGPLWPIMSLDSELRGALCQSNSCEAVPYLSFFTASGAAALNDRLMDTSTLGISPGTPTVVLGYSDGAMAALEWMAEHAGDPTAPSANELSFVLIGNPKRAYGGIEPADPPSEYQVIDIVRQYDPIADWPDNPFNLLALANVAAGALSPIHLNYTGVDLSDPDNVVWTEGNTTYVFVSTQNLPLLAPLRMLGMTAVADALNEPLKEIIESAYDRPYLTTPAEPTAPPEEPASTDDTAVTTTVTTSAVTTSALTEASVTTSALTEASVTADEPVSKPPRRTLFSKKVAAEEDSTVTEESADPAQTDEPSAEPADTPSTTTDTPEAAETPKRDTTASSTPKASTPHRWGRHRQE
ncbi:PE-PPE domain-containing protein [Mycolicibacterium psychrotolerans]|uniref:HTH tetR-type domain-containing protein n=1 Tax=Mycolicibacterium psychrotolerans TaxID=216929 RepID=A0A7I7M991_9MYCO|nr:PE-PPE domain-containing protein [Mycolicibacterium psychrotolerans]BBX68063.1 hypothetical protein MPSYJ_15240 [Mycolicibacterium psychrotolerans]